MCAVTEAPCCTVMVLMMVVVVVMVVGGDGGFPVVRENTYYIL